MIGIKVRAENIEGFDEQYENIVRAIEENLSDVATHVANEAKTTAAFIDRTGNLRGSIRKRKSRFENGGFIVSAGGGGSKKGYHAANVEFGHVMIAWGHSTGKRVPAHPFLRPALESGITMAVGLFRSSK